MTTETTQDKIWGWLTAVDMAGCAPDTINDPAHIEEFVRTMVREIDMVPIGDPIVRWCDTHDPAKVGWTFFQILQDSHIAGHLCSDSNCGYFDVFSCKPYEPYVVLDVTRKFFEPKHIRHQVIERIEHAL